MAYSAILLEHIEHPRNVGDLPLPASVAEVVNSACGDRIRLSLKIEQGRIIQAKMKAYGCPPTLAAASILTELISGKTCGEAEQLVSADIVAALMGLPRGKTHAADLAIEALQTALSSS